MTKRIETIMILTLLLLTACANDPTCPQKDTLIYLDNLNDILYRFSTTHEIAASTARIGLAPLVSELRAIQHELTTLDPPACASDIHADATLFTDHTISGYLAFMQKQNENNIDAQFLSAYTAITRLRQNETHLRQRWD